MLFLIFVSEGVYQLDLRFNQYLIGTFDQTLYNLVTQLAPFAKRLERAGPAL